MWSFLVLQPNSPGWETLRRKHENKACSFMVAEGEGGRIAHFALLSNPSWVFSGRLEVEGIVRRYYSGAAQNPSEVGAPSYRPRKPRTELTGPLRAPTECA